MSDLAVKSISTPEFWACAARSGPDILLSLNGNADLRAAEPISHMLPEVHAEACRLGVSTVVVDFRNLEFMNSSCFKSFVTWLSDLQEMDAAHVYRLRVLSDAGKHWQKRSLLALSCFAVDLVRVET